MNFCDGTAVLRLLDQLDQFCNNAVGFTSWKLEFQAGQRRQRKALRSTLRQPRASLSSLFSQIPTRRGHTPSCWTLINTVPYDAVRLVMKWWTGRPQTGSTTVS